MNQKWREGNKIPPQRLRGQGVFEDARFTNGHFLDPPGEITWRIAYHRKYLRHGIYRCFVRYAIECYKKANRLLKYDDKSGILGQTTDIVHRQEFI